MKMVGISMAMDGVMVAMSIPVAMSDDVATTNCGNMFVREDLAKAAVKSHVFESSKKSLFQSDEVSDEKENETAGVMENNVKIPSVQKVDYIDVNKELYARGQSIRRVKNNQADNLFHDESRDMPNKSGGNEKIRDSGSGVHVKYMKRKDKSRESSPRIKIKEMQILLRIEDLGVHGSASTRARPSIVLSRIQAEMCVPPSHYGSDDMFCGDTPRPPLVFRLP
ncbi:hypothetical protein L1987_04234 [Smallanthus sonchifolius]|uniref:Uncharacterized protein n=1 Tax=Smallanthus sonchifolius TaxID=185202 RepID=A0ACB9KCR8_9ASTR|nr:hypothetical protein L1987_04234 [Smallanthus sonchifolius]